MIWNWVRRRPLLTDLGLVSLLLFLTVGVATRHPHEWLGIGLGVVETLPLLWRRQQPLLVLALVTGVAVAMAATQVWVLPLQLGVALYTLATTRERRLARAAGAVSVGATAITLAAAGGIAFGDAAARVVFLAAAWLLGDAVGSRRAYVREIEEKAERLEREREAHARRVVVEEQARIGRELHDIVAHALSVIVVQAAAADEVYQLDPARTRAPIRAIDSAARAALADLRRVLGLLAPEADYQPQPNLAGVERLVEQVRDAGLEVDLQIEGAARPLPAPIELSAYRIVQEALTNTLKHAHAGRATVHVRYGDALELEISDDGHGNGEVASGAGRGLVGMRERVLLLGGDLDAGTASGGGFRVAARIPL